MKLTKKDLRTPDQVWQASKSLLVWLTERWVVVAVGAAIFMGLVVGGVYWSMQRVLTEKEAQYHLSQAKSFYEQWKLAKPEERAKPEGEILKELTVLETTFPKSTANSIAMALRGQMSMDQGKYGDAVLSFEKYSKSLGRKIRGLGLFPLASALEANAEYEKALKAYEELLKDKDPAFEKYSLLGKARAQNQMNRFEDAEKTYQAFLEKYPQALESNSVKGLLSLVREKKNP